MQTLLFDGPYAGLLLAVSLAGLLARKTRAAGPHWWAAPDWVLGWLWPIYLVHQLCRPTPCSWARSSCGRGA